MKKSQIYGQIFIYILTVLLTSLILIYGYNSVKNFKDRAGQVSCIKFKNDIKGAIGNLEGDYGTVKRKDMELCSDYNSICFIDYNIDRNNIPPTDPIIKDSIISRTGKNVFLIGGSSSREAFEVGKLSVSPPVPQVLCIKSTGGKISLRLEGKGDYVELSQWS